MTMIKRTVIASVVIALAVLGPLQGAHAATSGFRIRCSGAVGALISEPGTYKLKRSVRNCAATTLIQITASNVVVDLNGYVADGDDNACALGVGTGSTPDHIVVKNGTISDCANGFYLIGASNAVVKRVTVRSTKYTAIAAFGAAVKRCIVTDAGGAGIDGASYALGNTVKSTYSNGITQRGGLIKGNVVAGVGGAGIHDETGGAQIADNAISKTYGPGISGNVQDLIVGNRITDIPSAKGIVALAGSTVRGNRISRIGVWGIDAASGSTVEGNVIRDIGGYGIHPDVESVVTNNQVSGAWYGIYAPARVTITGNTLTDNSFVGISVIAAPGDSGVVKNVNLNDNVVKRSASGEGITVPNQVDSSSVQIARNVSNDNGRVGIYVAGTNIPRDSVWTNHAEGNAYDPQCSLYLCA